MFDIMFSRTIASRQIVQAKKVYLRNCVRSSALFLTQEMRVSEIMPSCIGETLRSQQRLFSTSINQHTPEHVLSIEPSILKQISEKRSALLTKITNNFDLKIRDAIEPFNEYGIADLSMEWDGKREKYSFSINFTTDEKGIALYRIFVDYIDTKGKQDKIECQFVPVYGRIRISSHDAPLNHYTLLSQCVTE